MSETSASASAENVQRARAAYLKQRLIDNERWSLRTLATRTGIGKGKLEARLNGSTEISFSDVVVFAEVLREQPSELFETLLRIPDTEKSPARAGSGDMRGIRTLAPRLGLEPRTCRFPASPAESTPREPVRLIPRTVSPLTRGREAVVTPLRSNA